MTNENFELVKADIRDNDKLKLALDGIHSVVQGFAAIVGDPACRKFSSEANDTQIGKYSLNLFNEAQK